MSLDRLPVGIDVSKGWFDVCLVRGCSRKEARFSNDEAGFALLGQFLKSKRVHICLEGTGGYERALCVYLAGAGFLVSRADSLLVRRFAQGMGLVHKTDRVDAFLLAEFCRLRRPGPMLIEAGSRREFRQLVRALEDLKAQRRMVKNRLKSPALAAGALKAFETALEGICQGISELDFQVDRLLALDAELAQEVAILSSIPGVAKVAALKILTYLPEGPLRSARALASYAGVIPTLKESGTSVRRGSTIAWRCNRSLRATLFMAAMVARRFCPFLRAFALKLVAAGKTKKQAIVAVMRKLAHGIFAVLTKNQTYRGELLCKQT